MITFNCATLRVGCASAALLALAGCAVAPPAGPRVMALPGSGKTYEQFAGEDGACRQAAAAQTPAPPSQDTTNAAVGSAVVGTAIGAAAGAAIGSTVGAVGAGAAVGGGLGLLAGSSAGASETAYTARDLQYRYDTTYTQCMVAHGNTVQSQPQAYGYAYGPAYYPYGGPVFVGGYYGPHYWHRY